MRALRTFYTNRIRDRAVLRPASPISFILLDAPAVMSLFPPLLPALSAGLHLTASFLVPIARAIARMLGAFLQTPPHPFLLQNSRNLLLWTRRSQISRRTAACISRVSYRPPHR